MANYLLSITCYADEECGDWCIDALCICDNVERFLEKKEQGLNQYEKKEDFWNLIRSLLAIETFAGYEDGFWPLPEEDDLVALETKHNVSLHMLDRRGDRLVEYCKSPISTPGDEMRLIHMCVDSDDIPADIMRGIMDDENKWQERQDDKIQAEKKEYYQEQKKAKV